jgi:CheY-like chemotaxis protein/putative methionine-R-sulfoxide reductase with GAF domain
MKNVLVVDDEETLLMIMVGRFEDYSNRFNVFTAHNGKEAVKLLESETIDLVVTDLKMPEMDGVELLAYMNNKWPHIPAIACSAYCTPEIKETLEAMGTLKVLDKPVDFDVLAQSVLQGLEQSNEGGSINCISLSSFMQIIQMEEKTCMLEVHGGAKRRGFIYMVGGELYDAECSDLSGEEAAFEMLAWGTSQLFLKDLPRDKREQKITKSMMSIVMEGLRRKDEAEAARQRTPAEKKPDPPAVPKAASRASPEAGQAKPSEDTDDQDFLKELDGVLNVLDEGVAEAPTAQPRPPQTPEAAPGKAGTAAANPSERVFALFQGMHQNGCRLDAFVAELRNLIPIDLAVLMMPVKNRPGYIRIDAVAASADAGIAKGTVYNSESSVIADVLHNKMPAVVDASGLKSAAETELFSNRGMQSCLYVPILNHGVAAGLVALASKQAIELDEVAARSDWVTGALALTFERDRLAAEHARQKEALQLVEQIGRALVSWGFDTDKVMRFAAEKIKTIMGVEAGTVFIKEKDALRMAAAFNTRMPAVKKFKLKMGQGIAGYVAGKGKSAMINDTQKTARFFQDIDKQTGFKTRSVLCVPMTAGKNVIGVFEVLNKTEGDFTDADETLLQSVASAISTALVNARMYKEAVARTET